ncbi:MAG: DegV family protein [Anaerolineales bacterium]|nr:DegV family protein [Anaerolineales bacterium]
MPKVAIITDSTAYIPDDLVYKYNIQVAPQILIWGDEMFADGVDILPSQFYERLKTAKVMPSTSQVTPATFHAMFQKLLDQDYQILAVLISEGLSGTIASAIQARDMFPGSPIEIVDSRTSAMALGYPVLTVAQAAAHGAGLAECKDLAEKACQHTGVVFAVDTLEFLHRGGRIGGAQRFLGTALNIKPILELVDGKVEGIERVRTRKKSMARLVELIEDRIGGRTPVRLASLHANAREEAGELLEIANQRLHPIESIFAEVSPVIGTHTGPGTVGLAFMAGL